MGLPNGASVIATFKGFVRVSDAPTLTDVLFVPQFSCNLLLSISQLSFALSCTIQFTTSMCAIQDPKELVGKGLKRMDITTSVKVTQCNKFLFINLLQILGYGIVAWDILLKM